VKKLKLPSKNTLLKLFILLVIVAGVGVFLFRNKSLFVVALVNNEPVFRVSLDQRMTARYGSDTLDEIVGEMLIRQAAKKNNVIVAKAEVDNKLAEIEKTLNGKISLAEALAQQGDTVENFRSRVELQLILEKLTAGETLVSEQEVTDYLEKNRASLVATDEAGMRAEGRQTLFSQKQTTALRQYFSNLRTQAKIVKFL
jgi:parvulin-like peptidyl-prolyl isomerase